MRIVAWPSTCLGKACAVSSALAPSILGRAQCCEQSGQCPVRNLPEMSLILLLTSKRVRSTVHGVPTPPPLDNLRDEVLAITQWWSKSFSHLIRCFAGRTGGANCREKANNLLVAFLRDCTFQSGPTHNYCTMCERVDK